VSLLTVTQFAKAAGCKVISTTSSKEKGDTLTKLGADHVINYKEDQDWGETAKKFTPGGEGVDHIIEVGGPTTMAQVYPPAPPPPPPLHSSLSNTRKHD